MKKLAWMWFCCVAMLVCGLRIATAFGAQAPVPEPCVTQFNSPNYPQLARRTFIQGKVTASVLVYRDGTAKVAKEGKGHPLLLGAAQENLATWRFRPNDSHEVIQLDVEYEFVLDTENPTDDFNPASTVTLDLPRHIRIFAPVPKPTILTSTAKKKHWCSSGSSYRGQTPAVKVRSVLKPSFS